MPGWRSSARQVAGPRPPPSMGSGRGQAVLGLGNLTGSVRDHRQIMSWQHAAGFSSAMHPHYVFTLCRVLTCALSSHNADSVRPLSVAGKLGPGAFGVALESRWQARQNARPFVPGGLQRSGYLGQPRRARQPSSLVAAAVSNAPGPQRVTRTWRGRSTSNARAVASATSST